MSKNTQPSRCKPFESPIRDVQVGGYIFPAIMGKRNIVVHPPYVRTAGILCNFWIEWTFGGTNSCNIEN